MLSYTDALDEVKCFFFMQKSAYDMRICDWSSDVCSSDLVEPREIGLGRAQFLLGILATDVQPRNPRRFFEQRPALERDRKSVVLGKRVSVRVDLGGCRILKKKQRSSYYIIHLCFIV